MTNTSQKDVAVKCLEILKVYKPYVRKFKSKAGIPCFFENYAGFYANQEQRLWDKIKQVESEFNCLVYAITHEYIEDNEVWSMLCVPENATVKDVLDQADICDYYAFAYVWNESTEYLSEFGDVYIRSGLGGLHRLA
jgi:hypothetical protein